MTTSLSSLKRKDTLARLQAEEFDLLIIGGGITGAGIALDAANRGMRTALVEMQDFAAGTSSRSSKMIHGGLRYLKKFEVKLVSQVGRERAIVYENGPHVTTPEWMILPIYEGAEFGKFLTSVGLRVYDSLAGVKKTERRKMLSRDETLRLEPKFKQEGLLGGGMFVEYRSDDARLTIEVMKEAAAQGATVINYTKVTNFIYKDDKAAGVETVDQLNGQTSRIYAKKIINAAGPWVDTLREKDHSLGGKHLLLTKGIHLVFDQSVLPLKQSVYFDTPDGRMILMIPRNGKMYVGTTDTAYNGDYAHPRITDEDIDYILQAIQFIFPEWPLSASDIESSWAGLRPLIHQTDKGTSEISRKDEVWESPSGLLTIAGGKLTGYRKMAETIVDLVAEKFEQEEHKRFSPCETKQLPISGGHVGGSKNFNVFLKIKTAEGVKLGLSAERAQMLVRKYGSNIDQVYNYLQANEEKAKKYGLPADIYAQVLYAVTDEAACTPIDFFARRTGALLFDIDWVREWKWPVIEVMNDMLSWTSEQKEQFTADLEKRLHEATVPMQEAVPAAE
ncbi:glycerol-3-phosphate dehydrogenase/oxidase [Bacillus thermotolerans]|uniref:glycerol-3-phosphate dehydrogenase/oxidase n=1 Tax=Bacillus thermotolerans TaxID=1221996 RepID=UPI00059197C3|nr:Aerobic glycerol-3-phosphate dehydrogenase [Bacillus thermotolerans]